MKTKNKIETVYSYPVTKFRCPHCCSVDSIVINQAFFKTGMKTQCTFCHKPIKLMCLN